MLTLPDIESSLWRDAYTDSLYPKLKRDLAVDAVIIGAGITGLTTAYLLKQAGLAVAVLEKSTVGGGTTGRTTGKVTSQHNLIYHDLQRRLGTATARNYGAANQAAVDLVAHIVRQEKIACDWHQEDNYVYTVQKNQIATFKQEARTAIELGLPASFETDAPLPFEVRAAVKFAGQAKIHSQKYLLGLAHSVHGGGSYVLENSNVIGVRDGQYPRVKTTKASVTAKNIIVATNVPTFPLAARGGYCVLEYPKESYIVTGRPGKQLAGMYISPDKGQYSILPVKIGSEDFVLIGGEGHISGLRGSKRARYQRLANYAERHFGVTAIDHRWSDRDYLAYDNIPLVGKLYPWSKHTFVATAFNKWGLSNGTVAAMLLRDKIVGVPNEWQQTFDSNRSEPIKSIPRIAAKYILRK